MKATLDQWRALAAVVVEGGYAAAAERLGRSQSAVSHAVTQLHEGLGVRLMRQFGRHAVLSEAGAELLRRARVPLDNADALETTAEALATGGVAEIGPGIEAIYPRERAVAALGRFSAHYPDIHVEIHEPVLSGSTEVLLDGRASVAITGQTPPGFMPEPFGNMAFVTLVAAEHPLATRTALQLEDLRVERQIVIRDSGERRRLDSGWLGAVDGWTAS